jgi:hypothetical protein
MLKIDEIDMYEFNKRARRELHEMEESEVRLLLKIMVNIINYPDILKYRTIKMRKISDKIFSIMALVGFVARIHVFEKHAILDISENLKLVKQMKMLINERIDSIENKKVYYMDVKAKLLAEKKYKEEVLRKIREDFEERCESKRRKEFNRSIVNW